MVCMDKMAQKHTHELGTRKLLRWPYVGGRLQVQ